VAIWLLVPGPAVANWTPSGCFFANARNSESVSAGTEGFATSRVGARATSVIGAKSRAGS